MKWWLISDEDAKKAILGLSEGSYGTRIEGLHAIESGLHETDCIPDDFNSSNQSIIKEEKE